MLRFLLIFVFLISLTFLGGVISIGVAPYYYYNEIIKSGARYEWYMVDKLKPELVTPRINENYTSDTKGAVDWKKFHFQNQIIPLPVNNPFYYISPIFNFSKKRGSTQLGISIANTKNEVIANIYFLSPIKFPRISRSQKLFKFPIVKNILEEKTQTTIWRDLFVKDISDWNIEYEEMVYNLYILELRNKIFNYEILGFGYDEKNNKGVIKVDGKDKDFNYEIILSSRGNSIHSLVVTTSKDIPEAKEIRNRVLSEIEFVASSQTLSSIIYQEFKALDYIKQIDHEGMLYLISAWSHKKSDQELLKYAIKFLERGNRNNFQLESLYEYMYDRYGRTFATKKVPNITLRQEVRLKLETELEELRLAKEEEERLRQEEKAVQSNQQKKPNVKKEYELLIERSRRKLKKVKNKVKLN